MQEKKSDIFSFINIVMVNDNFLVISAIIVLIFLAAMGMGFYAGRKKK